MLVLTRPISPRHERRVNSACTNIPPPPVTPPTAQTLIAAAAPAELGSGIDTGQTESAPPPSATDPDVECAYTEVSA